MKMIISIFYSIKVLKLTDVTYVVVSFSSRENIVLL